MKRLTDEELKIHFQKQLDFGLKQKALGEESIFIGEDEYISTDSFIEFMKQKLEMFEQ